MRNTPPSMSQMMQFLGYFTERGKSLDEVQWLLDSGLITDLLDTDPRHVSREVYRRALYLEGQFPIYRIVVDYGLDIPILIQRGGFDEVDDRFASIPARSGILDRWATQDWEAAAGRGSRYRAEGTAELDVWLLPIPHWGKTDIIKTQALLRNRGVRALHPREFVQLGIQHPELQREEPIYSSARVAGWFNDDHRTRTDYTMKLDVNPNRTKRRLMLRSEKTTYSCSDRIAVVPVTS